MSLLPTGLANLLRKVYRHAASARAVTVNRKLFWRLSQIRLAHFFSDNHLQAK